MGVKDLAKLTADKAEVVADTKELVLSQSSFALALKWTRVTHYEVNTSSFVAWVGRPCVENTPHFLSFALSLLSIPFFQYILTRSINQSLDIL